jgi:hypothetical protein
MPFRERALGYRLTDSARGVEITASCRANPFG